MGLIDNLFLSSELSSSNDVMPEEYYEDNKRYITSDKNANYDLTPITYADKSLGKSLYDMATLRETRLDSIFDIYKNLEQHHKGHDKLAFISDSDLYYSDKPEETLLRENFDAAIENLNNIIYAKMGDAPAKKQEIGGLYASGEFNGDILSGEVAPDTAFYADKSVGRWNDLGAVGVLFHEALLHGSGLDHEHEWESIGKGFSEYVDRPGTGQEDYRQSETEISKLFSPAERIEIVSKMYNLPSKENRQTSLGIQAKRY